MPYTATRKEIPSGDPGTLATVRVMQQLAVEAAMDPDVRDLAIKIMRPGKIPESLSIYNLRQWVAVCVHFVRDPVIAELVIDPRAMVRRLNDYGQAWGDCDDVATLIAALAMSVGYPARFVVVGFAGGAGMDALDKDDPFGHIWAEVAPPTGRLVWTEMDTTRPMQSIPMESLSRVWIVPITLAAGASHAVLRPSG